MARSRNIKPGYFANELLAECDPLARILFAGLWTISDRSGRLEDRPKRIKRDVLPYDNVDIETLLRQLIGKGFILRYEVGESRYIQILNFGKHQNPHRDERKSTIPPPSGVSESTEEAPKEHSTSTVGASPKSGSTPADSLNLIPDSGSPVLAEGAPRRDETTNLRELRDAEFVLRLHEKELKGFVAAQARAISQENECRNGGSKIVWGIISGMSFESQMKSLIYTTPDTEKIRILSEAYNVLGEKLNWANYVELAIRYTLVRTRKTRVENLFAFTRMMLARPGEIVSARSDGILAHVSMRETAGAAP